MSFEGVVRNGMVVIENGCPLPEGTRVEVVVKEKPAERVVNSGPFGLLELAGTVDDLPSDMARNHDHYIHGAPKR